MSCGTDDICKIINCQSAKISKLNKRLNSLSFSSGQLSTASQQINPQIINSAAAIIDPNIQTTLINQATPPFLLPIWATRIVDQSGGVSFVNNMVMDPDDNIIVTGSFFNNPGTEVELTPYDQPGRKFNLIDLPHSTNPSDGYIVKYSPNGIALWSTKISNIITNFASTISTDTKGNIIIAGPYEAPITIFNSNGTVSSISLPPPIGTESFVIKYNANGFALWAARIGGLNAGAFASTVTTDSSNNIIIGGDFNGAGPLEVFNADGSMAAIMLTHFSGPLLFDSFVIKFDFNGFSLWGTQISSPNSDQIGDITADSNNNVIILGHYQAGVLDIYNPGNVPSGLTLSNAGGFQNVFLIQYNPNGIAIWAVKTDGNGGSDGLGVTVDSNNNIYFTGNIGGSATITFFNPNEVPTVVILSSNVVQTGYVVKYNSNGFAQWAARMISQGSVGGVNLKTDSQQNIIIIGGYVTPITIFSTGDTSSIMLQQFGTQSCFIAKYDTDGTILMATRIDNAGDVLPTEIVVDSMDNFAVLGSYEVERLTFFDQNDLPTDVTLPLTTARDIFIAKYACIGQVLTLPLATANVELNEIILNNGINGGANTFITVTDNQLKNSGGIDIRVIYMTQESQSILLAWFSGRWHVISNHGAILFEVSP